MKTRKGKEKKKPNVQPNPRKVRDAWKKCDPDYFNLLDYVKTKMKAESRLLSGNASEKEVLAYATYLEHKSDPVRSSAAGTLAGAAKKGTDISPAFPALIKALSDPNHEVRSEVVEAFLEASMHDPALSEKDLDISDAIPGLMKLLSDPQESIRSRVIIVLSGEEYRSLVFNGIMERIHSEQFQNEMEKNSPVYVRTADAFARLLDLFRYDETLMVDIAKNRCEQYEKKK